MRILELQKDLNVKHARIPFQHWNNAVRFAVALRILTGENYQVKKDGKYWWVSYANKKRSTS